jgi:NAD(P)H-hydrate epimerase
VPDSTIPTYRGPLPALAPGQLSELARLLVEEEGVAPLRLVERSGQLLARLAQALLEDDLTDRPVVVLAGGGNKGATGLAAAGELLAWGAWVQIVLIAPPTTYQGEAAQQLAQLQAADAPLAWAEEGWELPPADLVIDALIGYGLHGAPTGQARTLIHLANSSRAPILSLDVPSGMDAATGAVATPHLQAAATLARAWPAAALLHEPGRNACGELYLADVGVPSSFYARLGVETASLFASGPLVRLDGSAETTDAESPPHELT